MKPSLGRYDVLAYIREQIGTDSAWQTSAELAKHFRTTGDHMAKLLWNLRGDGLLMTRMRPGTSVPEVMASPEGVAKVIKPTRQRHSRREIVTPAAGTVGIKKEAVPAPRLPEPTPEAREAVERLVRSPTPALTLADVLAKQKAARQPLRPPATHKCTVCGAHWIHYLDEGSWSLHSETCGACCDNAPMGDQIVPIETPTEVRVVPMEHDPTSYIDEVSTPTSPPPMGAAAEPPELAGIAERCAEDDELTDPIEDEIYDLIELARRGTQRVTIERVHDKVHVLMILARALRSRFGFDTSPTAALLDEIATDLERVAE